MVITVILLLITGVHLAIATPILAATKLSSLPETELSVRGAPPHGDGNYGQDMSPTVIGWMALAVLIFVSAIIVLSLVGQRRWGCCSRPRGGTDDTRSKRRVNQPWGMGVMQARANRSRRSESFGKFNDKRSSRSSSATNVHNQSEITLVELPEMAYIPHRS